VQVYLLSFEGPDAYAQAGGIASRVTGPAQTIAEAGFATHLWFVGNPTLPGHETRGQLSLHRWCQWISQCHPAGVYDGEEGKQADYAASLPPFLLREVLFPYLHQGGRAVILAEEWHTVHAVLHLDWLLRNVGLRERVTVLWNANNTLAEGSSGLSGARVRAHGAQQSGPLGSRETLAASHRHADDTEAAGMAAAADCPWRGRGPWDRGPASCNGRGPTGGRANDLPAWRAGSLANVRTGMAPSQSASRAHP
jgi:hypothetical protein